MRSLPGNRAHTERESEEQRNTYVNLGGEGGRIQMWRKVASLEIHNLHMQEGPPSGKSNEALASSNMPAMIQFRKYESTAEGS